MKESTTYWKKIFGIDIFKVRYYSKWFLYKVFGLTLPKLKDQRAYWRRRGQIYMQEIFDSGYLDREVFFQDMLIEELRKLDFTGFFEAGCGFGWNIKRVKEEFPSVMVGGVDFSITQLQNSRQYLEGHDIPVVNGDNCFLPFKDDAFDVGFSLGVFMNIHPARIKMAVEEMVRVCKKYIIHLEYDENNTTPELKKKRAFKTNIVSHDYKNLYESLGKKVVKFQTYRDFGAAYQKHQTGISTRLERWEGFEGPEKYIFIVIKM